MAPATNAPIPETHELIRDEDVQETLDLFENGNDAIKPLSPEQHAWVKTALAERQNLCARQFHKGSVDAEITDRLHALDGHIKTVSPNILQVLHFLGRIRAIIPVLMQLREGLKTTDPDPNKQMIKQMQYDCSKAEVQAAIEGLAVLRIHPRVLDELTA